MRKRFNSIGVTAKHHVTETNVVVGGVVSSGDGDKESLLVEFNAF